jgi:FG-GAP-like repeat
MTRKIIGKAHTLRGIFQFFGVLTALLGIAALAQTKGIGQASAKPHVVSALPDASSAGHVAASHAQQNTFASNSMAAAALQFLPVVTYDSGGLFASFVAVADLNSDGKPDLVVANCGEQCFENNSNGSVGVLLGNGDGTFQPAVTYNSGGQTPLFVAVADVNCDGKFDLVVANRCDNSGCLSEGLVTVLLGNGDGTFQAAVGYGSGGLFASAGAVADVNGDGKPDLLVANQCADSNCDGSVAVLLGNGNGTFQAGVPYPTGGLEAFSVAVADVNGDGKPDLLVATDVSVCYHGNCYPRGSVSVLRGNGDGTFRAAKNYRSGGYFLGGSVVVADVNGDGTPDIVAENSQCCGSPNGVVSIRLGKGKTFQKVVTYQSGAGGWGTSAAVADVDGDGKPDLVVTDQCGGANCNNNEGLVGVLSGNGDGTFQTAVTYNPGGFLTNWVAVADVNGDGRPDLIVANQCADNTTFCTHGSLGVLLNDYRAK